MAILRALITLINILLSIVFFLLVAWIPRYGWRARLYVRMWMIRWMLWCLNIKVTWHGTIPHYPCIYVGNHRSYLDPLFILKHVLALPIAKAEVASWPLLGYAVRLSGIVFVRREDPRDRKRALSQLANTVRNGDSVLLFPEGTTHADAQVRHFSKGIFHVAAETGMPLVPFALEFADPSDYWINDDTFGAHFLRQFGNREVRCGIHIGPVIRGQDAMQLREEAIQWINGALWELRKAYGYKD
jgi:1-acyl-sn-glycerol-3-phosphate acyltransferase